MVDKGCNLDLLLSILSGVVVGLPLCFLPEVNLPLSNAGEALELCPLPGVGGVGMLVSCCFVG